MHHDIHSHRQGSLRNTYILYISTRINFSSFIYIVFSFFFFSTISTRERMKKKNQETWETMEKEMEVQLSKAGNQGNADPHSRNARYSSGIARNCYTLSASFRGWLLQEHGYSPVSICIPLTRFFLRSFPSQLTRDSFSFGVAFLNIFF